MTTDHDLAAVAEPPSRFWPTYAAALAGYIVARACGIPVWYWDRAGDAFDIGMAAGTLTFVLLGYQYRVRNHLQQERDRG